ncbi:MAG: hypothetical protein IKQ08_08575 [Paludibacteraceae bacterium]|nr:hypothetical protein [Paludibacteraceae bacterium]
METRQMIIEMKYTDSIKDNPIKNDWNDASIEELLNLCDESIELDLEQLNKIQEILLELEHNDSEDHTFFDAFKSFWEIMGSFLLIEIDIQTAFRYILQFGNQDVENKNNDLYYRFFVRRIYTLAYETLNKGLLKKEGQGMQKLRNFVTKETYDLFLTQKKKLQDCLEKKEKEFHSIRNVGEAHKDRVDRQIKALESISVKDSFEYIFSLNVNLENYRIALITLLGNIIKTVDSSQKNPVFK